ncbi:MAG: hypothetical protein LBN71_11225 [Tannerella sp.]|jgi:hypothetical protein|nr:hypothetical protein [Tannerella sp.]
MKTGKFIVFFLLLLTGLSCCKDDDEDKKRPARTVLVYMVASNLGSYLQTNIDDMISVATAKNLNGGNLIVFYSRSKESSELFEIKERKDGIVVRNHIRDYDGQSAVDPATMRGVIEDVMALYPNDSYGLILSSHATAWMPSNFSAMPRSFGEENKKNMEIYELAEAIPDHVFDFLISDACSMGAIECVYELRDKASYIVASAAETPVNGFPYKQITPCLFTDQPDLEKVTDEFYQTLKNYSYGNIAITKTSGLVDLAHLTREIISTSNDKGYFSDPLPDWQVLTHFLHSPTRLYDFDDVIKSIATEEQQARFSAALGIVITNKHFTENIWSGNDYDYITVTRFSGLSVYPLQTKLTELNSWYKQLEWYKAVYE